MKEDRIVRSVCGFCSAHCRIALTLKDGRVIKIEGYSQNPNEKAMLCKKGKASLEYLYNEERLKYPIRRVGQRGEGKWKRISWNEAFNITAKRLNETKQKHGSEAVFMAHGYAKAFIDTHLVRLANAFGTPNVVNSDNVCHLPRMLASELTFGFFPEEDMDNFPACIIAWGTNKYRTGFKGILSLKKVKSNGAKMITIDPQRTQHARESDMWLRIKPGTDLALALGFINVIINEELYDKCFIEKWSIGFEELRKHVQKYNPKEVSKITWVSEELIVKAARMYAKNKPAVILSGNALDHNVDNFQKGRAISILMALTGNLDIPGGEIETAPTGYLFSDRSLGAGNGVKGRWSYDLELRDLLPMEKRKKKVGNHLTLLPDFKSTSGQAIVRAILEEKPYEIRAGYIQAANPLSSWANINDTYRAFKKLDFLAVSDFFMTPTAMMADIVFPASTHLEFDGIRKSVSGPAIFQRKVEQIGECRSDHEIINGLAKTLGLGKYFWKDIDEFWDNVLENTGLTFEEFKKIGFLPSLTSTKEYRKYEKKGFNTLSGKVELYSDRLKEWGLDPLPQCDEFLYTDNVCRESVKHSFFCTSYKSVSYMHSSGKQIKSLRNSHMNPTMFMNCDSAHKLQINDGDWVYIETKKGKIKQKVKLRDDIDPRVVILENGWWFPEIGHKQLGGINESNYNVLTDNGGEVGKATGSFNIRGLVCKVYKVTKVIE
jgi:anaerobic selenocysteine-containing dehydrogenase